MTRQFAVLRACLITIFVASVATNSARAETTAKKTNEAVKRTTNQAVTVIEIDGALVDLSAGSVSVNAAGSDSTGIVVTDDKVTLPGISVDGDTVQVGGIVINNDGVSIGGSDSEPVVEINGDDVKLPGIEIDGDNVSVGNVVNINGEMVSIPGVTVDGDSVSVGGIRVAAGGVRMPGIEVADRRTNLGEDSDYKKQRRKTRSAFDIVDSLQNEGLVDLTILFAHDSDALKKRSYLQLDQIAEALEEESLKSRRIVIEGHTDSSGGDDYNMDLSIRRSLSVFRSLVLEYDFEKPRFVLRGFGERLPVAGNDSKQGMKLNRRVTLSLATYSQ